jgi:MFS superfamily sulfate permease-like transporter
MSKRVPASLVTMILAGLAAYLLRLDQMGVALIGPVASGLPDLEWPDLPLHEVGDLAGSAAGLALVLFTSGMLTARSFAERNGYDIDVDREFAAFRHGQHRLGAVAGLCRHRRRFAHGGQ